MTNAPADADSWRQTHAGHWLRLALERFDARVLALMAHHAGMPLGLSNLLARQQVGAAHIHITRHLAMGGARLTELARAASMTKQAMATLVAQCEAWGMVERTPDPRDARAQLLRFTPTGLAWLQAYRAAVEQAEQELRQAMGDEVATVLTIGLEMYASQ